MTDVTTSLQWIVGSALIVGAVIGTIADLAGVPTVSPAYFAVAIAAGAATFPTSTGTTLPDSKQIVPVTFSSVHLFLPTAELTLCILHAVTNITDICQRTP